jgi:hypothetical protein
MSRFTTATVALLATISFATSATAENPCGGKPKPKDPKTADIKPKVPEEQPAPMPEKPTPPPELLAMAKAVKGTWSCKGEMTGAQGAYKTKFTVKNKLDLGNMWIKSDMTQAKSKAAKYPFKFTGFTTYSAGEAKWHRVMVDNWGSIGKGWSTGPDATGKTTWEMEMTGSMGSSKFRDYEEPGPKKKQMHMWGEMSMDGGGTWVKVYDATCTKF